MARRFKQLTKADRLKIEALDKAGRKVKEIAEQIGVHQSTIYRELKRGQIHPHQFRSDRGGTILPRHRTRKVPREPTGKRTRPQNRERPITGRFYRR